MWSTVVYLFHFEDEVTLKFENVDEAQNQNHGPAALQGYSRQISFYSKFAQLQLQRITKNR